MYGLSAKELRALRTLDTPIKVQGFLDTLPMNWEKHGETHYSPRGVLRHKKAHCIEGAVLAAAAFWLHGRPPLLMDLSSIDGVGEEDHVIALYKRGERWGAVGKTNHATIRFRDPVYKNLRELAMSFFHEWFMNSNGLKTLESYSLPLDLRRHGDAWMTAEDVWWLDDALNARPHVRLLPLGGRAYLRCADPMELKAGRLVEWPKSDPRT